MMMGIRSDARDSPLHIVNERIETVLKAAVARPWTEKRAMAVFRGELRKDTWASGLPNGANSLAIDTSNWWQYSRGKLLALRQEPGAESMLNVNLMTTDWHLEKIHHQMGKLDAMHGDEPALMGMVPIVIISAYSSSISQPSCAKLPKI